MNGDADAARRVAEIRAELRRVFVDGKPPTMTGTSGYAADPTPSMENQIDLSKFLTHLERCKTRAREDAKHFAKLTLPTPEKEKVAEVMAL